MLMNHNTVNVIETQTLLSRLKTLEEYKDILGAKKQYIFLWKALKT